VTPKLQPPVPTSLSSIQDSGSEGHRGAGQRAEIWNLLRPHPPSVPIRVQEVVTESEH
jgi:hypothetical protein